MLNQDSNMLKQDIIVVGHARFTLATWSITLKHVKASCSLAPTHLPKQESKDRD